MYDTFLTTSTFGSAEHPTDSEGLLAIHGEIRRYDEPDHDLSEDIVVGTLAAYRIFTDPAATSDMAYVAAMCEVSAELEAVARAIDLGEILVDLDLGDLLVVTAIEVAPEHRGQDLPLRAIQSLVASFGSRCRYLVIGPVPGDSDVFHRNGGAKRSRLERHFARLGARQLPTPGFLIVDLFDRSLPVFDDELPDEWPLEPFELD